MTDCSILLNGHFIPTDINTHTHTHTQTGRLREEDLLAATERG